MKQSKKERTQQWLQDHHAEQWLRCIHCDAPLHFESYSLHCDNGHRFDGAKQGYYYLTTKQLLATKYDHALFEARRYVITKTGFYRTLHEVLIDFVNQYQPSVILDAGSGEGSHLAAITAAVKYGLTAIGVDLAKDGIQLSTTYNGSLLSLVSDLAYMPIADGQVNLILSILSPANYQEFNRILAPGGKVLKVVPNADYLVEIRQALQPYHDNPVEIYDNTQVIDVFQKAYPNSHIIRVHDDVRMDKQAKQMLVAMTPLAWQLSQAERQQVVEALPETITLDVSVLMNE
ncbi:putative RNA methyltransferase [Tuanshanicoccus lijuaniae]|uniref:putative RNA methyltransferase n=1 Tax=Aerococcaceae bacterium zg-1292 TaxID=2774330 RepID=UPI001BD8DB0C|nr:methyltransferase domain-containing protein [Aerococcaceae bacterium zg-A91]MBS4458080.1 methyltransferase domain-containing protein [Aerococcaceae bacterium zg-BR33]